MSPSSTSTETASKGLDLSIVEVELEPKNPAVRERFNIHVLVKNTGDVAIPAGTLVPLDVKIEGMGLKVEQVSRNYKEGIAPGQTVKIIKNLNGPWVGNLSFSSDIIGDYTISAKLDPERKLAEVNAANNGFLKKLTLAAPTSMTRFAIERAVRSYSSLGMADSLVSILRLNSETHVLKAAADGWNYRLKNISPKPANVGFLQGLYKKTNDDNLKRLLETWKILEATNADPNVVKINIKSVKEAMKFDKTTFSVKSGAMVELTFENIDAMQHNLVIVKPKTMEKVGLAADKMMMDEKGLEKNYVPALSDVLFATPLVNPDRSFTLKFKAPAVVGNYPYVCTFPGHWRLMNGTMKVIK
jgi:uncharacterized protein